MNKSGYFFLIDSLVAIGVLTVGIVLILSYVERTPRTEQPYTVSEDILNLLQKNRVRDINNNYIDLLRADGNITDTAKPLMEQIAEFYYRGEQDLISPFLRNITRQLIPSEYNYVLNIDNTTVHNVSRMSILDARYVTPARAVVHGLYKSELYGPYSVEVISWG